MSNEQARDEFEDVLSLVGEQMEDLAAMRRKQSALTATAEAADGHVEVTVDAQGMVIKTDIDPSYLEEFEFIELGDHITRAAQDAVRLVGQKTSELMTPLRERRKLFPSLSDIVDGAPDLGGLVDSILTATDGRDTVASAEGADWEDPPETVYPTVRS